MLTAFLWLNLFNNAQAQYYGWNPANMDYSNLYLSSTSSTQYFDADRAGVVSATNTSGTLYALTLKEPTGKCLGTDINFSVDDRCLLIQMEHTASIGNKIGVHCGVEVVSYTVTNCSTAVLNLNVFGDNTWANFDFGSDSRVQVLKVPVIGNLYLNPGGEISCEPYNHDDGTGGIVAFFVDGTLNFNGGIVNATGKGYQHGWVGSSEYGLGGDGATPSSTYSTNGNWPGGPHGWANIAIPGGENPPTGLDNTKHGFMCGNGFANANNDLDNTALTNGSDGGEQNTMVGTGGQTNFSNIVHYDDAAAAKSASWTLLRMGKSGEPGSDAGEGGEGGGVGGDGGSNLIGAGSAGGIGQDGGRGGDVGLGGRGGGIILIKCVNVAESTTSMASSHQYLISDGEDGGHGDEGLDGGDGGTGGMGSPGTCNGSAPFLIPPGGIGGYGESGIGAGGGDGGDGGEPGTIWVMKKNAGANLSSRAKLSGGQGGGGGYGGYSLEFLDLPIANNYVDGGNPVDLSLLSCAIAGGYYYCAPTPSMPSKKVCDCDEVFRHIGEDLVSLTVTMGSGGNPPYTISGSMPYNVIFEKNANNEPYLHYTNTATNTTYNCYMYKQGSFIEMLKKAPSGLAELESYSAPSSTYTNKDVGVSDASYDISSHDVLITYNDLNRYTNGIVWDVFKYESKFSHGMAKLIDVDNPGKRFVIAGTCTDVVGEISSSGGRSDGAGSSLETGAQSNFSVPKHKIKRTGSTGSDGSNGDGSNGDFVEDDNTLSWIPPSEKGKFYEITELVSVLTGMGNGAVQIHQTVPTPKEMQYAIFSMDGKLIQKGKFVAQLKLLDIAQGNYFIIVSDGISVDRKRFMVYR